MTDFVYPENGEYDVRSFNFKPNDNLAFRINESTGELQINVMVKRLDNFEGKILNPAFIEYLKIERGFGIDEISAMVDAASEAIEKEACKKALLEILFKNQTN